MRQLQRTLCGLLALLIAGCAAPAATPQRLPTRAPTPVQTPTPTPFSISAQAYYEAGLARQEVGDTGGALQLFTWAIQLAPDFALAYVARGAIYLAQESPRQALAEADAAIEADPDNADAHALRGETLRLQKRSRAALESFEQAVALDPTLGEKTFRSRWLAGRAAHDAARLLAMSREYAVAHQDDPLRHYYRGWALAESDTPELAVETLVEEIKTAPDVPAALWFALGQAYAAVQAWPESVTAFEAARVVVQAGDTSMIVHSDQPIADLFTALGQAYLRAGRCVDAEAMLKYAVEVGAADKPTAALLEEASSCQTPTPTFTPYPTATPLIW
jgi:tetratricopeptide (TPR) repeat protein